MPNKNDVTKLRLGTNQDVCDIFLPEIKQKNLDQYHQSV